jgi:catechol 2,3-dioxygenase-like lactoylglutathione lyase family enzyme
VNRSREFYQNTLGLSLLKEEPPNTVLMTIDGYQFLSLSNAANQKPGSIDHFCVATQGFTTESAMATLKQAMPELKATQARNEFVFFNDPDGTRIQLAGPEYKG